jgi:Na+-transporting NADH:ubiquinone oxidoreductase subunit NqrB
MYWALSGYGERPSWALAWLAVFLVGMAGLVRYLGLHVFNPSHIANFGDCFLFILQKATLQHPIWAEPIGFLGKLVAGLSVLFIPGQAALFLLALRNRLGRRR